VITTILVEHPWMSPAALAALLLLGPFVARWLAARPRLAWAATALALLPVALLTLVPVDRELVERCEVAWTLPTPGRVELAANVILFAAPALLAVAATRRPLLVVLAGSGLSAAIEALQAAAPVLGRSCSTNDWLSNTIGTLLGAAVAAAALAWGRDRGLDRPSRPDRRTTEPVR
jgi:hypothetical protein